MVWIRIRIRIRIGIKELDRLVLFEFLDRWGERRMMIWKGRRLEGWEAEPVCETV
jgi:hypothetical protein